MANKNFEVKHGLSVGGTERITAAGAGSLTNLTLSGNLTVQGTTVTLDASTLQVADKNIVLNYHASNDTSSAANGAGITIQDAVDGSNDATLTWDTSLDKFDLSHGLHIGDSAAIGTTTTPALQIGGTTTYRLGLYTSAEGGVIENKNGDDGLQFKVKTAGESMRIDGGTGNVLVGKNATGGNTDGMQIIKGSFFSHVRNGGVVQVLNRKTSDGDILQFEKDNSTVGSIGTDATDIYIGTTDTGIRFNDAVNGVLPYNTSSGQTDNTLDLGFSSVRWKDLYLAGTANIGEIITGSGSNDAGSIYINDASSTAYTLRLYGTGTREFEFRGSDSGADYNTTFSNHSSGGHNLIVDGIIQIKRAGDHPALRFVEDTTTRGYIASGDWAINGGADDDMGISGSSTGDLLFGTAAGVERMRIFNTGEFHITGGGAAIAPTIKYGGGIGDFAKLRLINRSGQGANKGGILELGGITNDGVTRSDVFAALHGGKDNGTSGNKAGYMDFHTSNGASLDQRMRLTSNGELLIGDTSLRGSVQRGQLQVTQIDSNNAAGISCISGNDEIAGTFCLYSSGTASAMISVDPDQNRASSNFYIHIDGAQKAILDSAGNFTITGSYGSSDRALKENIVTLPSQLEKVKQLNPVSFDWKEKAEDGSTESSIGFIAQEVEELYPNLIRTPAADSDAEEASTTQYKSLNYAVMVSILTKAVQEQQTLIESLETRLEKAGL